MMVYRAGNERHRESSLTAPDTAYGISKLLGEMTAQTWQAAEQSERKLYIVRPGVVFGRGEHGNFTRLYHALRRGTFAFVGRRSTIKGWIYVKDLVRLLVSLAEAREASVVLNAAHPEPHTIETICRVFCSTFGLKAWTPVVPYRLALVAGYAGELFSALGLDSGIHHRRMQKLYFSTDLDTTAMLDSGFACNFDLRSALADWRSECLPGALE
jgi:nucleoside-diphosphate-sugar epimerase